MVVMNRDRFPAIRRGRRAPGFTLIELVVAITVFSILLGFGIPEFLNFLKDRQVRTAAESLQNDLRLAQIEAMKRNLPTELVLTSTPVTMSTLSPSPNSTAATNWVIRRPANAALGQPTAEVLAARNATDGFPNARIRLRTASNGNPLRFTVLGRTATTAGVPLNGDTVFQVRASSGTAHNLCVVVSPVGSIQLCDGALSPGVLGACSATVQPLC